MTSIVTWISLAFILIVFAAFCYQLYILHKAKKLIDVFLESENILDSLKDSKLEDLYNAYSKTLVINTPNGIKSNIPSYTFFNEENVSKSFDLNIRLLDTASGTLVGLGLLGTFGGLTLGITGFNTTDSRNILQGIQNLLDGMSTAFSTSLIGMFTSLVFTYFDRSIRNKYHRNLIAFSEKIDDLYYIDDNAVQEIKLNRVVSEISKELNSKLQYSTDAGETVSVGNAIREILKENLEQSRALKSFSTDLAMELNNGFDEVLSRQMQSKILPLMESVDATTKAVVEHIDQMASTVASPASGMMESVVEELKKSMTTIIDEFKANLAGSATSQLEELALQMSKASQTMGSFPENMENISNTLQITIEEVKTAISEISKTSANANSTAMQQMQEQITFATSSISNAITEVREVMNGITQNSQEQSQQMVSKLADATEKIGSFLDNTIASLSTSVQNSMKSITDDVSSKQADLIALQEDTTSQTKKLLDAFNVGLERLEKMNEYVTGTMNGFKQAQGEITISTGNLRTISGDMKLATELFNKGQNEYTEKLNAFRVSSQQGMEKIEELLVNSGEMSEEYARKFEIIKDGLSSIFSQLQTGLKEYSRTVQSTTQKYLDQYTTNLTQTTDALSSTIQQQNEVVEMLNEILSRKK